MQKRPIIFIGMSIDYLLDMRFTMGWLRLVGSLKLQVCFAKEPYKRDDILQKRPANIIHCRKCLSFIFYSDEIHYRKHRSLQKVSIVHFLQ